MTLLDRLRRLSDAANEEVSETVWLPVVVAVSRRHDDGSAPATRKSKVERAHFVVERVLGHGWAVSCDPVSITADGRENEADEIAAGRGAMLPARLAVEDCHRPVTNLAARASFTFSRGRSLDALELEPVRAGRYPFLVRYQRRRSQRVDFEAVDGVTGRRAGSSLRAAIAAALIDSDRVREQG